VKLVFLGPPGAGKGTQAERICEKYDIVHISTGEILRGEIRAGSELGLAAKKIIDSGALVSDDIIIGIVEKRTRQKDCEKGFLLDGFPRTIAQAKALDGIVAIDGAINIDVPFEKIVGRISGRRMCRKCGATYHVSTYDKDVCACGGELYQRDDDKPETVENRLAVYLKQTQPLIDYYAEKKLLYTVDGEKDIDEVFRSIVKVLERFQ